MTKVEVFAPAKINLTLHVTGKRADGYHLLDSLVAFGPAGDTLQLTPARGFSLTVDGPEGEGVPTDDSNLALRAAKVICGNDAVRVGLTKHLPAAAGIGGGSSDAAAAVRGALALQNPATSELVALGPDVLIDTRFRPLLKLGADIPMCLLPKPLRARGIGEQITFENLPGLVALLINPRVPVPTAEVFAALEKADNPPMTDQLPTFDGAADFTAWLGDQRNDLEAPATRVAPVIGEVLALLRETENCQLARMSGSGATCFGIYPDEESAKAAGHLVRERHSDWWLAGGKIGGYLNAAMPKVM